MEEVGTQRSDIGADVSQRMWLAPVGVAMLSLLASGLHAALGPGFVLDDWFTLRNAAFGSAWDAAGVAQQTARPGAAVAYAFVFGVVGPHPMVTLAILAVIGAATAALMVLLFRPFFPEPIAVGAATLWVLLPNHLSLEVWASAVNIALSVLLVVAAGVLMLRSGWERWLSVLLMVSAALCYEAVMPVAAVLVIVAPWKVRGRVDVPLVVGSAVGLGGVALWIVTHWHPDKHVAASTTDLGQAVGAHLGWGIAPDGAVASVLMLLGIFGVVVAVARLALPSFRGTAGPAELAVVVGVAVVVLGTVPFARYLYAPLGAGDRFNFISSIGGALVWAGIVAMAWASRRVLAVALMVALLAGPLVARVQRSLLWHRAGEDAVAVQEAALRTIPQPNGPIAVGPQPIQQENVAAYLDQSNVDAALQLAYGDPLVDAVLTFSAEEFLTFPASQRIDMRPISQLESDVVVTPD